MGGEGRGGEGKVECSDMSGVGEGRVQGRAG